MAIIGHSISHKDKLALITKIRSACDVPILALKRPGELPIPEADEQLAAAEGPQHLLETIEWMKAALTSPNKNRA
jgi:hypothetical protein